MKVIAQRVQGKLLEANGQTALLLFNPEPSAEETADSLYLRYAFVLQGVESPIFPAELLDDWGNSIKRWEMYEWIFDYADDFPRAEIFGFDGQGKETQCFLRDLELTERVHCYAYGEKRVSIAEGVRLAAILLPTDGVDEPVQIEQPIEGQRPFAAAKLGWWQVPRGTTTFHFSA